MVKRRRHNEEFKREAVRLVTEEGYSSAEAARSLGIPPNLLRTWHRKYAPEENGDSTRNAADEEELRRLREENRRLRREREILTKRRPAVGGLKPLRGLCERKELRFAFIREHQGQWRLITYRLPPVSSLISRRLSLLVRGVAGFAERVLRLAESFARRPRAASRGPGGGTEIDSRRATQGFVWLAADAPGVAGSGTGGVREHGGQADEKERSSGHDGAEVSADDGFEPRASGGGKHVESGVSPGTTEPGVGQRHHVHPDARGLVVPGVRAGSVLAEGRGLVDVTSDDAGIGARRPADGAVASLSGRRIAAPFGSRQPVRQRRVPATAEETRHHLQHEQGRPPTSKGGRRLGRGSREIGTATTTR